MTQIRLQRLIAQAGVAARRKAEELILAGRVTVDGKVVTELGTKVDPAAANVQVDGNPVAAQEHFYILFNKPKGCITAVSDDRGRITVMDYLPNLPVQVAPVGRLDFYSEGVLLLTNDGELAAKLLAPGSHVPKTYHVKVNGILRANDLQRLREGVTLDDGTVTAPAEVEPLAGSESKHPWLAFTLYEGKSRQIHRMLEALGHRVSKLQRVAFANLTFHGLRIGDARELSQQELNELRGLVGLDRRAVARGRWSAMREDTDRARGLRQQKIDEAEAARAALEGGPAPRTAPPARDDDDDDDDDNPSERDFERQLAQRTRGGGGAGGGAPDRRPAMRDDRRGPPARDDRRGPPARDDRRGPPMRTDRRPPMRDDRRGPPARDDRRGPPARDDRRGPPVRTDRRPPMRDDRRGPPARDARRGPPARDARRGPPARDDRRGPPARDDRRPISGKRPPAKAPPSRTGAQRGASRPGASRPGPGGRPAPRKGPARR